jgi:outer membrane protein assembly factor BamB
VFVAAGSLWLGGFKPFPQKRGPSWGPYFATQRDLATGEVLMHVEAENPGHHHRCYQNKATDRYILAGRRGTEFIDLATGEFREHSWARGVCKYGIMPCNGLMYAPPHACACYVGTKVTGFSALAAAISNADAPRQDRLVRGPAYDQKRRTGGERSGTNEWATYRCDAERSGSTDAAVATALKPAWQRELGGRLSAPVVADGRVFVASADEHTVHALDADSGESLWDYTAAGRVDSAPTVFEDRVLFGSRDGRVYCLRVSDGALAWRYEAARTPRRIVAHGQLESVSPVHGSVLVQDGAVCFAAGRSSYLDGGIDLCRLDLRTGKELSRTPVYSPDPQTHKQPAQFAPSSMPGVRSDILAGDGEHIYLRDMVFDARGAEGPEGRAHLIALTDFLDDTWPHRSYWIYGTKISISTGCSGQAKNLTYGRLLVFDDATIYGYGRAKVHWSNQLQDGSYRLFAAAREDGEERWEKPVKAHVRAMVLADKTLFVAGAPAKADTGPGAPETEPGGLLLAVAAAEGATLAQYRLPAAPTFDAMAASRNRLYLSLESGTLTCFKGGRR